MNFETDVESEQLVFRYSCPCGDRFLITLEQLYKNRFTFEQRDQCIAICPSCSLKIKVIFDQESLLDFIHDNLTVIKYPKSFDKESKLKIEFPSMPNYDLKAFELCLKQKGTGKVLFWNVL